MPHAQLEPTAGSKWYLLRLSLVAALGGLLFGYDTAVISGAIGFLEVHFGLTAAMKGWAASSALVGCFVGVLFAGYISDRYGRRAALIWAAVLFFVSAVGSAIPRSLAELVAYRILGGLGVGIASMASPMYIAEISPARLRGRMVSVNQFAIIFGMLVVYFVNYAIAGAGDEVWNIDMGWRWMFGSEAIPAFALLVLLLTVPETPRFLMRIGKEAQARGVLERIEGAAHADAEQAEIRAALGMEPGRFSDLFRPGLRFVIILGILLAVLQQVTGINVFLYYAPEILRRVAGADTDIALLQTILVGAVNLGFTVVAIWVVDKLGRKPLMIAGSAGMGICLAAIGLAAMRQSIGPWLLLFMLGYIVCFALSVGPVTWVLLSELFPNQIRGRAMAVATFALWLANFVVSQTFPMMDGNAWLVERFNRGFPFLLYAFFCLVLVVLVIRWVPETKGRSLEEIERMWLKPKR